MQPMPEALTNEKIFPVLGKYQLADKEGAILPLLYPWILKIKAWSGLKVYHKEKLSDFKKVSCYL